MKTIIVTAVLTLFVGLLFACSESPTEGCWITHANGVKLNPSVQFPVDAEPIAMNPGVSYQVWCAREISASNAGDIITEDRQTLRIASLPSDVGLEIYPNEREAVYRGHPVPSSADVWNGFEDASRSMVPNDWSGLLVVLVVVTIIVVMAFYFLWFRNGQEPEAASNRRY